jgi:hypothetical protein
MDLARNAGRTLDAVGRARAGRHAVEHAPAAVAGAGLAAGEAVVLIHVEAGV